MIFFDMNTNKHRSTSQAMLTKVRLQVFSTSASSKLNSIGPRLWTYRSYSTSNSPSNNISRPQVKWFYATDVPNSKPTWHNYTKTNEPKKFIPFSDYDSTRLEKRYQKYNSDTKQIDNKELPKLNHGLVEVNEDKLFQVDLKNFDLSPVYWDGPVYEVRRGTWFNSDGIPLGAKLSHQIEEGYRYRKAFTFGEEGPSEKQVEESKDKVAKFNAKVEKEGKPEMALEIDFDKEKDTFGLDNGQVVLFCNAKEAVLFPSSFDSNFQLGVIRSFGTSSGSLISVEKIQRGYTDDLHETVFDNLTTNPIPGLTDFFQNEITNAFHPNDTEAEKNTDTKEEPENTTADQDKQMKHMLESDFDHDTTPLSSEREVDHLVLCIHGIGQILGHKYESVNFVHSINVLRNTMKEVYQHDKGYQEIAYPEHKQSDENKNTNNRIQILPISWRHKIDFHPQTSLKSYDENGKLRLPSLAQISVDGVKSLRNILGDVVLDILLYYEPKYINQITKVVTEELNRVYVLYMEKNPNFKGKVHIMGHSLGSVISFDILSSQPNDKPKNSNLEKDLMFDVDDLFCVGSPIGVFKLLGQTNIKPRSLLPSDYDASQKNTFASPKCSNLYNIFHPCDPIGYRMEPLINPEFSNFKPELVPFAVKGLNTQIKELAHFSEEIQEKLLRASSWFNRGNNTDKKKTEEVKSIEETASEENALDDILFSLAKSDKRDDNKRKPRKTEMNDEDLATLTEINKNGRVDYSLPMGVFDFSLVSAISAHISYFEDKDTAGFIMKQLLLSRSKPVESKSVSLYK